MCKKAGKVSFSDELVRKERVGNRESQEGEPREEERKERVTNEAKGQARANGDGRTSIV